MGRPHNARRNVNMQSFKTINSYTFHHKLEQDQHFKMVPGDRLVQIVRSEVPASHKLAAIVDLKTHIKTNHVNMTQVHFYIEALSLAVDIPDHGILSNAFSTLSHLVKRISIQDLTGSILESHASLILPSIITRLGDSRSSSRTAAKNALEAFWLLKPAKVEQYLRDIGLAHRNSTIACECVSWLRHIFSITPHFKLTSFLPTLVLLLTKNLQQLQNEVCALLQSYYKLKHNKIFQIDLLKEFENQNIPSDVQNSMLPDIAPYIKPEPTVKSHSAPIKPTRSTSIRTSRPPSRASSLIRSSSTSSNLSGHRTLTVEKIPETVSEILALLPGYGVDFNISAKNVTDYHDLHEQFQSPAFQGKETEFNWTAREKYIINLRAIIRGNALKHYQDDLISCIKESSENIIKAATSLRTTLSTNGCQLVKEIAIMLGTNVDPLIDCFMSTFMKLCSSTKNITSNNANIVLCALFSNCSFNSKIMVRALMASLEKNAQPRTFSGIWLQIFVTRFQSALHQNTQNKVTGVELCQTTLMKILKDPNPTVRTSAKTAYWCFANEFPEEAQVLLSKLDTNTVRALQRSKPLTPVSAPSHAATNGPASTQPSTFRKTEFRESSNKPHIALKMTANLTMENNYRDKLLNAIPERVVAEPIPSNQPRKWTAKLHTQSPVERLWNNTPEIATPAQKTPEAPKSVSPIPYSDEGQKNVTDGTVDADHDSPMKNGDQDKDIILNFLSSFDDTILAEGVGLLKFAIIAEEELSQEFPALLAKISNRDPSKLERLFTVSDEFYKKSFRLFSLSDYLRLSFVFIDNIDSSFVLFMISQASLEELFDCIIRILSYTTDRTNIVEGDGVMRQVIRYKQRLWRSMFNFLTLGLDKMAISDGNFRMLSAGLFEVFLLVQHTPLYEVVKGLLRKLYPINRTLFTSELQLTSPTIISEVERTVGIDNTLSLSNGQDFTQYTSVMELTKVNPVDVLSRLSPVKDFDNFSTLMEIKEGEKDSDCEMHDDPEVKETESKVLGSTPNFSEPEERLHSDHDVNVFVDQDGLRRSDMFAKFSQSATPSSGLVDGLALVQLSENEDGRVSLIQDFIEKVDPLKRLSSKRRSVSIYEDNNDFGSPQKVKEHSYSTFNWFNFQVARAANTSCYNFIPENDVSHFQKLCSRLELKTIEGLDFMFLLNLLQSLVYRGSEFYDYFQQEGFEVLVSSLWKFLGDQDLSSSLKLQGLIIVKQLLVNREPMEIQNLWRSLVLLSVETSAQDELYHGIRETFDEMLSGLYATQSLLMLVVQTAKEPQLVDSTRVFVYDCLFKTLNASSNSAFWTNTLLIEVDLSLRHFMDSDIVDVRRYVMLSYGILHKIIRSRQAAPIASNDKPVITHDILDGMTGPQQKLVCYYSQS